MNDKKCLGCGQVIDVTEKFCRRCWRLKHYGELDGVDFSLEGYQTLIKQNIKPDDLVLLVIDVMNIPKDFNLLTSIINTKQIKIILTKIDLLPTSVKLNKLINNLNLNWEVLAISSTKRYNLDYLYQIINQHAGKVVLVGQANAGKSTLINQLINSYTKLDPQITVSQYPGTTLDILQVKFSKTVTLVDTPGFINQDEITNYVDPKLVMIKNRIKPKILQVKNNSAFIIENILRIEYQGDYNSLVFYINNNLLVSPININTNKRHLDYISEEINIEEASDIVINGLGFIKIVKPGIVKIYLPKGVRLSVRKAII